MPRPPRDSSFVSKVDEWIASRTWSKDEQVLLILLRDAERQGNLQGARGAIERLLYRPSVEDLKDPLIRHLGELNTQLLFSGTNTPWTATVAVKRGDTLQRIAANHRTTLEALQKLNPMKDPNRLALGQKLRVLNFPDADLVVHKQLQFAELLLKKRIRPRGCRHGRVPGLERVRLARERPSARAVREDRPRRPRRAAPLPRARLAHHRHGPVGGS